VEALRKELEQEEAKMRQVEENKETLSVVPPNPVQYSSGTQNED
jgi:hypothetical protein